MNTAKQILTVLVGLVFGLWVMAQPVTLVTLGDSLTAGDGDDTVGGGYPPRLLELLQDEHPGSTLDNLGISGDTSDDLINKQLTPAVSLLEAAPAGNMTIALVWIGSNDLFGLYNYVCDEQYQNNYAACEADTFATYSANLDHILTTLSQAGARLFIALLDDQSKRPVMTDPALRGDSYGSITDEDVQRMSVQVGLYNDEIARLAGLHGATTVDFFHTTIFEDAATLSQDGNHPNASGYDVIADLWFQAISGGSVVTPDSNRWIFHVTSFFGGFRTRLVFLNTGTTSANVMLAPRAHNGQRFDSVAVTVDAGHCAEFTSSELFGSDEVSHFSIDGPTHTVVTAAYRIAQGLGASAHVNESTLTGRRFLIYPGEQDVVFDGLALVNLSDQPSHVTLSLLDAAGVTVHTTTLSEGLGTKEKLLATLDGLPLTSVASVVVSASQTCGVTFLRGTRPGVTPGYLYQVVPIVLE